jgi:predicted nucleotidyltransferase
MSDAPVQLKSGIEAPTRARIEEFAKRIAREFHPERIILFGSHARGDAGSDSDVDLLVIMAGNGKTRYERAFEIRQKVTADFPLDLLVRTPEEVQARMGMNDWFMHDIMREGITLYAA